VHNDPVIRQADANRLAAREARPQAWAAVLPQLNGTASATGDHNAGEQPFFGHGPERRAAGDVSACGCGYHHQDVGP